MARARPILRRRGSVYVLIIGMTMLAAAITIAASLAGRAQSRVLNSSNNASEARSYAQAAIDLGRLYIAQDSNWRTTRANGTWFSGMSVGSGSMQLDVVNPSGSLNRFSADPIVFTGTGTCGTSVQKMQVSITPQIKAYNSLASAMCAAGPIQLAGTNISTSGVLIAAGGNITASSANISANVEAVGAVSGSSYYGSKTSGATARKMPGSNVFDYYTTNGSTISLSSLPFWSGTRALNKIVVAPDVNPYGATNPNGIYVIDCQGQLFTIGDVRICATVVLLNCGGLTMKNCIRWTPAISTLPALMVQGTGYLKVDSTALSETLLITNFNPPGAPYPWPTGTTDTLILNNYAVNLRGLMYFTGSVTFGDDCNLGMLMSGGGINTGGKNITLNYTSDYLNNPPPGFYDVDMTPASMTYTQITN